MPIQMPSHWNQIWLYSSILCMHLSIPLYDTYPFYRSASSLLYNVCPLNPSASSLSYHSTCPFYRSTFSLWHLPNIPPFKFLTMIPAHSTNQFLTSIPAHSTVQLPHYDTCTFYRSASSLHYDTCPFSRLASFYDTCPSAPVPILPFSFLLRYLPPSTVQLPPTIPGHSTVQLPHFDTYPFFDTATNPINDQRQNWQQMS